MSKLRINFLGKELKNPVITSSGCFGYGEEYNNYFNVDKLGTFYKINTTNYLANR